MAVCTPPLSPSVFTCKLPFAIRAAVHSTLQGRFNESRNWLMAIDPMRRDRTDPTYKALRFQLAWARARTSLNTDLSRNRSDLVRQAEDRMVTQEDQLLVAVLKSDVGMREGRVQHEIDALLQQGHSVVVIEHHLDVLKCADHILDLGPGGGKHGGTLVHEGTPESLVQNVQSLTGRHLAPKLQQP